MPFSLFSQAATGASLVADTSGYTMGVQFSVSKAGCTLTGVWFNSASGATVLPQKIELFAVSGATLVHSETASWSGAAGSGWVRAVFSSPPSLTASTSYKAAVYQGPGANWYSLTAHYWDSGAGSGGITNGPLSAPANSGADGGQDTFNTGDTYPNASFNAGNYWVDPEITAPASASGGLLAACGLMRRRRQRPRARGRWGRPRQAISGVPTFTIGLLTAFSAPGIAGVQGVLDEVPSSVLDEAGGFILSEDGS